MNDREMSSMIVAVSALLLLLNLVRAGRARKRAKEPQAIPDFERAARPRIGAAPYALAGLIGAGLMSWIMGTIFALELHGIYRVRSSIQLSVVLAALVFSVVFAAWRGFPARLRPSLTWGARIFLPL